MAVPGISTIGVKLGWARGAFGTRPLAFTELTRINQIGGISLDVNTIDASSLIDTVDKMIAGRASTGGTVAVTVNMTDDTLAEWEEVFLASAAAQAAGETIWFENWSPQRQKAFYWCAQTPTTFPMPEEGQNSLETVEINLTINEYVGPGTAVEPEEGSATAVTGVALDESTLSLNVGESGTLTATVSPSGARQDVTWASTDTSVATVSDGTVKGIAVGSAVIVATTVSGNKTATCAVTVS